MIKKLFEQTSPFKPSPGWMIISYVMLAVWTFFVLFPLYWLAVTAFKLPIDVSSGPKYIPWVDFQPSLHAWQSLLFDETAGNLVTRPYRNTIISGLVSSFFALIIGTAASYALMRFTYRPKLGSILSFVGCSVLAAVLVAVGLPWIPSLFIALAVFLLIVQTIGKRFFKRSMENSDIAFWLISNRILPPVAVIIPIYILFQQLGLLDTLTALIITYTAANLPIAVWFMRDYISGIPLELEESAFIDGASRYQVLFRIVLPLATPGMIATFLIVLVFSWNEYIVALFLSGATSQTMPLLVSAQNATRGPQWWNISVLVLLMIGPIIILAMLLERFIARGILIGAVKG
ncbi:MAG: carbohydrate ABC transporter permease [Chloroflexota bacterium]